MEVKRKRGIKNREREREREREKEKEGRQNIIMGRTSTDFSIVIYSYPREKGITTLRIYQC